MKLSYFGLLVKYLKPQWLKVIGLALALFSTLGLQLVTPLVLREFIDKLATSSDGDTLVELAWLFLGLALAKQMLATMTAYSGEVVAWTATNALRGDLVRHCLGLDLAFYHSHTPGEMVERLDGDITALHNFFSKFVIYVLGNLLLITGMLVVVFSLDWRAGLAFSGYAFGLIFLLIGVQSKAAPRWAAARQASAGFYGFLQECLSGVEDLRANGATGYVIHRFQMIYQEVTRLFRQAWRATATNGIVVIVLYALATVFSLGLGASFYQSGLLTLGSVYLLYSYVDLLYQPLSQLSIQLEDLQKAGASIGRVQDLLTVKSVVEDKTDGEQVLPTGPLSVEFDKVCFSYNDTSTLEDISFHLPAGQKLGVVGPSGSGKTTLSRLLFRLYDPTAGVIRLGGTDIRKVKLTDLRRRVALVTQDITLFAASVRDNLTFFDSTFSNEQLIEALYEVGLEDWYRRLPRGLDTQLEAGAGGNSLSGGEAQLLALARVFLTNPDLVILDEASSRLDPYTEQRLERALTRLLAGHTAIIIAHRLETLHQAKLVLVVENGRIIEFGQTDQLEANSGSRFYRLQQQGKELAVV